MVFSGFKITLKKQHNAKQKKCSCPNIDTLHTGHDSFSGLVRYLRWKKEEINEFGTS